MPDNFILQLNNIILVFPVAWMYYYYEYISIVYYFLNQFSLQ